MFLGEIEIRPVQVRNPRSFEIIGLALGQGPQPLEILIARSPVRPNRADLVSVWKSRLAGRATPLLLVVLHGLDQAALCGPAGDDPPAFLDLNTGRAERICRAALLEPDRHAALRFLHTVIREVETPLAGLRNEGLFATHELECGVPGRDDWVSSVSQSRPLFSNGKGISFGVWVCRRIPSRPSFDITDGGIQDCRGRVTRTRGKPGCRQLQIRGSSPRILCPEQGRRRKPPLCLCVGGPSCGFIRSRRVSAFPTGAERRRSSSSISISSKTTRLVSCGCCSRPRHFFRAEASRTS